MIPNWQLELLTLLLAGKTSEAFQHKEQFLPSSLYRYRSFSNQNILNLENHHEWLSTPQNFNDVFDCCVTNVHEDIYDAIRKSVDKGKFGSPDEIVKTLNAAFQIDGMAEMMIDSVNRNLRNKDVHICCFSERINSTVMWAHYADQHKGYCIAYDFKQSGNKRNFFPVLYEQIPLSSVSGTKSDKPASNQFPLLFKDKDWSYEREWRLIYYDLLVINNGSQLLQMSIPSSIYLGMYADQPLKEAIRAIAEKQKIPLFQMQPDFYKRELNPVRVF